MQSEDSANENITKPTPFPIVGVGASAGGLDAFKAFLETLPEQSGMAYVFIMHLSRTSESQLPQILQKHTTIPVETISDKIHLQPDHIYIIPPNKMVTAFDGVLILEEIKNTKNTIDLFFSSLGVVHQSFAVGVVLSGSLNDGTLGLQVIKSYGGLTFAQDEGSAAFDSMPKSAVRSGAVDFVLPANQIIPKLISINHTFSDGYSETEIKQHQPEEDEKIFKQLITLIRLRKGLDFINYKQSTIKRRIVRRMALSKITEPKEYLSLVRDDKAELDALYNDMLISVTSFFRDSRAFHLLRNEILPKILKAKTVNEPIRIWVAGCATGEEAYSIAISIHDYLGDGLFSRKVQIFATDVSEIAIEKARTGLYRQADLNGLSEDQIERFFHKLDGKYQVSKPIREMCIFAPHNLLKDPPFSKVDLVTCRNVLIYFESVLQKKAFAIFHYALNEKGFLMLGKSETIGSLETFNTYNKQERFYQSKGAHGRARDIASTRSEQMIRETDEDIQDKVGEKDVIRQAKNFLLENYAPANVVVNHAFDILEFSGNTSPWLTLPRGRPNFNILKIASEGLSFEIRNLLHTAKTKKTTVRKEGIFFKTGGEQKYVDIEVSLLPDNAEEYYLVIFRDSIIQHVLSAKADNNSENVAVWITRNEQLEKELAQAREDMRSIAEMQETVNEELQSVNEELLSGSEELQSVNEELETSKEELESTNEEIIIVNTELLDRNAQLNSSRRYIDEIFRTIHEPVLVLDLQLEVVRATDGFYKMFRVIEKETEGKYFYELGNGQWNIPELRLKLEELLNEGDTFITFDVDHVFNNIGRRVMQLSARHFESHNHEKLVILAIHDITDKRNIEEGLIKAELLLEQSKERLHFAVESAGIGIWDHDLLTDRLVWDMRCKQLFHLEAESAVDHVLFLEHLHQEDREKTDQAIKHALSGKENPDFSAEYRTVDPNSGEIKWIKSIGKAHFADDKAIRFSGTVQDISIEKYFEEKTLEMLRKKDEFMSIASHELRTPITSIKAILQLLEKSFPQTDEYKLTYGLVKKGVYQVNKLTELINELFDVTKIQTGKLELHKTTFDFIDLVTECTEQLQLTTTHKVILKEITGTCLISADKNRIEQVLTNLINNAIKYSPEADQVILKIEDQNGSVKITVTDFGIGIAEEKVPFIFNRFFRVDESAQNYAGLGLGLYISAEIIVRHGGKIGLESIPGQGSEFWFTLPKMEA